VTTDANTTVPAAGPVITVPELSLVVLIGVSGSGKSTFAARHFRPTEVLSSDTFRGLVGDDETDQSVTPAAFRALYAVATERLKLGRLTVIDATSVQPGDRQPLIALARAHHVLPVAIALDLPERVCAERNAGRAGRDFGLHVIGRQHASLKRSLRQLSREGFRRVFVLRGAAEVDAAEVVRERAWSDRTDLTGPFDIIGDVHGCAAELASLLGKLGYRPGPGRGGALAHPAGRTAVFVGDLVDRGPDTPGVLRTVRAMTEAGSALCVAGNHENKLVRALRGRNVTVSHGLAESLAQLAAAPEGDRDRALAFMDGLLSHYVLDGGRLVVAHAGLPAEMHGRASAAVRSFALYGETTGETDEYGLPVRYPWARDYRGRAMVVYGHTPVPEAEWLNNTICVDTGCVFGGHLTALRYPERELVSVPAEQVYHQPARPLGTGNGGPAAGPGPAADRVPAAGAPGDLLTLDDVAGRRVIETRLRGRVTVPEANAAAALEVMSRFAVSPRWLVYLPPTMAPVPASTRPGLLEHPADALDHYRRAGVASVVCEEKHMGSRAVTVVCRTPQAARDWFGAGPGDPAGLVCTRTGRRFFADPELEAGLLGRLRDALTATGLWDSLGDWAVLDGEILPWSLKAAELIRTNYAAPGAAATALLAASARSVAAAQARGLDEPAAAGLAGLAARTAGREQAAAAFRAAYRPYAWPVRSLDDVRLAPFQLLAGSAGTCYQRPHAWHLEAAARLAAADPLFQATRHVTAGLDGPGAAADEERVTAWWQELTGAGGEGMVVKPAEPVTRGRHGLVQPGVKCRGPEYLRLIYGPEYLLDGNLGRLRDRTLDRKRALALREYALGIEALDRFTAREPLYRVHECVFGVLALESDPVDPRL
jgi:polynucleotide kinase-phosphatase